MVIPNFVRQALAGQPITVFGDGTQCRSFTYVGDVVRAMVALINEPAAVGQVFNIGNGAEISINALAEKVKALTGSSSEIVRIPYDQAYEAGFEDMPRRVPDLDQAPQAHRIPADGGARRNPRQGHRVVPAEVSRDRRLPSSRGPSYQAYTEDSPGRQMMMRKNLLCLVFALAAFGVAASTATAGELSVKIANGRATIIAKDVPVRQILAEWAKVGETKILNGEKSRGRSGYARARRRSRKGSARRPAAHGRGLHRRAAPGEPGRRFAVRPRDRPRDEPRAGSDHEPDAAAIRKPRGQCRCRLTSAAAG